MKRDKRKWIGLLTVAAVLAVALSPGGTLADINTDCRFLGPVTVDGNSVPGAVVTAWIGGSPAAPQWSKSTNAGPTAAHIYESWYVIDIPADNPATSEKEGGVPGDTVNFSVTVGGLTIPGPSSTWQQACFTDHSLHLVTTTGPRADLALAKADSPDPVVAGGQLTYTVTVSNGGPDNATGVVATDTLPGGVTFVSATASVGTASHAAGVVTWTVGNLANEASATLTILVTVNPGTTGTISDTANVTGTTSDPTPANNTDTEGTTVVPPEVDLAVAKADSPDPVVAGRQLTYTVTVSNNGPDAATGVVATDTLPPGVTFVSATPSQGTCSHAAGVVTCQVGNLANGASATLTIVVTVNPGTTGTINNMAQVVGAEADPNLANNTDTEPTTMATGADLAVAKADSPDPVVAGGRLMLTYTVTVRNNGPDAATGVVATDTLPPGVTFVSATPSQGACSHAAGVVTCQVGNLANEASATLTIVVTVGAGTRGTIDNTATVTGTPTDPDLANNTDTEGTKVVEAGDADGDGDVDMGDRTKVERIILGLDPPTPGADCNQDGSIDMADTICIERKILAG